MTTSRAHDAHDTERRALDGLAEELRSQAALADALVETLLRQRHAVACSDAAGVDAASQEISLALVALDERRAAVRHRLDHAGVPEPAGEWPEPLRAAREHLRTAVQRASREAGVNRAVLQRSLERGEAWLQALFSAASEAPPVYGQADAANGTPGGASAPSGLVLDRRV